MQRRKMSPVGGADLGERIRLTAASQANGSCARGSALERVPVWLFDRSTTAGLSGSRSPLRLRLIEMPGFGLVRLAPALRNGSIVTNSAASAAKPTALTIRRYRFLPIGPASSAPPKRFPLRSWKWPLKPLNAAATFV